MESINWSNYWTEITWSQYLDYVGIYDNTLSDITSDDDFYHNSNQTVHVYDNKKHDKNPKKAQNKIQYKFVHQ